MSYAYDNVDFSHYYDTFVNNLPSDVFWIDTVSTVYAEIIRRTLTDKEDAVVVDLGCGTGENLLFYADHFKGRNVKLIGVDHSQAMLDRAKEKFASRSIDTIELVHGSLTNFASVLGHQTVDCLLLSAGTFHHLITDNERRDMASNIQQVLRPQSGLFVLYLMPEAFIRVDVGDHGEKPEKLRMTASENVQQPDGEWLCKAVFEFDTAAGKSELSWQTRTCIVPNILSLLRSFGLEPVLCCLNGKELVAFDETTSSALNEFSTPVILVFRKI